MHALPSNMYTWMKTNQENNIDLQKRPTNTTDLLPPYACIAVKYIYVYEKGQCIRVRKMTVYIK